jgi:hypothetical protein
VELGQVPDVAQVLLTRVVGRYADLCRIRHKSAYAESRVMPRRGITPGERAAVSVVLGIIRALGVPSVG